VTPTVARILSSELGMQIGRTVAKSRAIFLVVDIEILTVWNLAFIGNLDSSSPVEGHLQKAIEGHVRTKPVFPCTIGGSREGECLERVHNVVPQAEKVA
jgi:hypothetical protein